MYVLVEAGTDTKTHNFTTIDDLAKWVDAKRGCCHKSKDNATSSLTKVKEFVESLLDAGKPLKEGDTCIIGEMEKKPINTLNIEDKFEEIKKTYDFNLRGEIFTSGNFGPRKLDIDELCNWFISNFCVRSTGGSFTKREVYEITFIHAFLANPEYITQNPAMIRKPLDIPSGLQYIFQYDSHNRFVIANYLNKLMIQQCMILSKDTFLLFRDLLKGVNDSKNESIIIQTIHAYIRKDRIVEWWLSSLFKEYISTKYERKQYSFVKSSDIFSNWQQYVKELFVKTNNNDFKMNLLEESLNKKQVAAQLKTLGYSAVRKSAGIFYSGLAPKTNEVPSSNPISEVEVEVQGFDKDSCTFEGIQEYKIADE